jgi:hypothetical protein
MIKRALVRFSGVKNLLRRLDRLEKRLISAPILLQMSDGSTKRIVGDANYLLDLMMSSLDGECFITSRCVAIPCARKVARNRRANARRGLLRAEATGRTVLSRRPFLCYRRSSFAALRTGFPSRRRTLPAQSSWQRRYAPTTVRPRLGIPFAFPSEMSIRLRRSSQ